LWYFGIFFPVLVFCTKKNLATLIQISASISKFSFDPKICDFADLSINSNKDSRNVPRKKNAFVPLSGAQR
jgi:hypothetical protein